MTIANYFDDVDDDDDDDNDDDDSSVLQINVQPTLVVDCIMTLSGGETGQATLCREDMDLLMIMMIRMIMMIMRIFTTSILIMMELFEGDTGEATRCRKEIDDLKLLKKLDW